MPDDQRRPTWSEPAPNVTPLFGLHVRQPPSNVQAEQALLGALLWNNRAMDRVPERLLPEHFSDPIHGRIFDAIRKRIAAGRIADAVSLKAEFEHDGDLEANGGAAYLAQLLGAMVGIINAGEYAIAVHECWLRRELIEIGENIVNTGFGSSHELDATAQINAAEHALLTLSERDAVGAKGTDFATAAPATVRRAEAAHRGDPGHARLDTGVASVDGLWNGLWPAELYYLMARSRTGKTPAMLQIARNVAGRLLDEATRTGEPVGHVHIISLEMTAESLLTVSLAGTTRWTADQIRAGEIGDARAWHDLEQSAAALGRLPIVIDDCAEMDLTALAMRARSVRRQKRTRLICIDYRELVRRPREHAKMGLPEWIPYLGYQLKALAKIANVPVIALAQINKSRDSQESQRPTLSDLPYDGGQAADAVFALHRPELYMGDEPPRPAMRLSAEKQAAKDADWHAERDAMRGVAEFIGVKRRLGPPGFCRLRFDGPRMLLRPWNAQREPNIPFPESESDYG